MDWQSHSEHILFLSVDLVGSTSYKQYYSENRNSSHWLQFFELFYTEFPKQFTKALHGVGSTFAAESAVWKTLGDEIIFHFPITHYRHAEVLISGFVHALQAFRAIIHTKSLDEDTPINVKGTSWLSEFPVQNAKITAIHPVDFIGPSIDVGFRIAKFADSRKLVISVEVARLLLERTNNFKFFYDGMIPLKGAFGGKPYPIIWIDTHRDADNDNEARLRRKADSNHLKTFCDDLLSNETYPVHMPFFPEGEDFTSPYPGYVEALRQTLEFAQLKSLPSTLECLDDTEQEHPGKTEELFSRFQETFKKSDV